MPRSSGGSGRHEFPRPIRIRTCRRTLSKTPDARRYFAISPAALSILANVWLKPLITLAKARHGYGIMREVARQSDEQYQLGPGTLYDNLQKLMTQGLVEEAPRPSADDDPRRRYYLLTKFGRRVLEADVSRLKRVVREASFALREPNPRRT